MINLRALLEVDRFQPSIDPDGVDFSMDHRITSIGNPRAGTKDDSQATNGKFGDLQGTQHLSHKADTNIKDRDIAEYHTDTRDRKKAKKIPSYLKKAYEAHERVKSVFTWNRGSFNTNKIVATLKELALATSYAVDEAKSAKLLRGSPIPERLAKLEARVKRAAAYNEKYPGTGVDELDGILYRYHAVLDDLLKKYNPDLTTEGYLQPSQRLHMGPDLEYAYQIHDAIKDWSMGIYPVLPRDVERQIGQTHRLLYAAIAATKESVENGVKTLVGERFLAEFRKYLANLQKYKENYEVLRDRGETDPSAKYEIGQVFGLVDGILSFTHSILDDLVVNLNAAAKNKKPKRPARMAKVAAEGDINHRGDGFGDSRLTLHPTWDNIHGESMRLSSIVKDIMREAEEPKKKWDVKRMDVEGDNIEVFVSPDGSWYKKASGSEHPDLEIPMKHGMSPLRLVNIDHWRPTDDDAPTPKETPKKKVKRKGLKKEDAENLDAVEPTDDADVYQGFKDDSPPDGRPDPDEPTFQQDPRVNRIGRAGMGGYMPRTSGAFDNIAAGHEKPFNDPN